MIMAVHTARIAATAPRSRVRADRLRLAALFRPTAVASKTAHRRPVGHRGRRPTIVESLGLPRPVGDAAADDREVARDFRDFAVRAGEEIAIGNDQISELPDLYKPLFSLLI